MAKVLIIKKRKGTLVSDQSCNISIDFNDPSQTV